MADRVIARGPGRVNLIGEHTDYNEGLALPFALDDPGRAEGWRAFVRGTVAELRAAGHDIGPCRLTIEGDLPRGAGLSSSAALTAALCLALVEEPGDQPGDRVELARLCSRVENDHVGAETGLLDQL